MRVNSKGQVTIPQEVRLRLGIEAGSEVDFEIDAGAVYLVRRSTGRSARLVTYMRGRARTSMSTDETMAFTRGDL